LRDLTRARDRIRADLLRARHRVSKLLLRYGRMWPADRGTWTREHHRWLEGQRFDDPNLELAFLDALAAVDALLRRRDALDQRLIVAAQDPDVAAAVARLCAFRGINTLTAVGLHAEIHDWQRFARPGRLAAWLGLVPSLYQSGESAQSGAITKSGSRHARRLLVEAAWHYQRPPSRGVALRRRQDGVDQRVVDISWAASIASIASTPACVTAASPPTSPPSPLPASSRASSGMPCASNSAIHTQPLLGRAPGRSDSPARPPLLCAAAYGHARS